MHATANRNVHIDFFKVDVGFEERAHDASAQALINVSSRPRSYALVSLDYRGNHQAFAIPLRSNVRWDTPSRWYLGTPKRETTRPGNRAGFDLTKMIPVSLNAVSPLEASGDSRLAQIASTRSYDALRSKAESYLSEYGESRGSNTDDWEYAVDIDAILDDVVPLFSKAA